MHPGPLPFPITTLEPQDADRLRHRALAISLHTKKRRTLNSSVNTATDIALHTKTGTRMSELICCTFSPSLTLPHRTTHARTTRTRHPPPRSLEPTEARNNSNLALLSQPHHPLHSSTSSRTLPPTALSPRPPSLRTPRTTTQHHHAPPHSPSASLTIAPSQPSPHQTRLSSRQSTLLASPPSSPTHRPTLSAPPPPPHASSPSPPPPPNLASAPLPSSTLPNPLS